MILIDNKLIPADGKYLQRISDGTVAEGIMYIPLSLTEEDFREISYEEYLKIINAENIFPNSIEQQIKENKKQINTNSAEITDIQIALCELYEQNI